MCASLACYYYNFESLAHYYYNYHYELLRYYYYFEALLLLGSSKLTNPLDGPSDLGKEAERTRSENSLHWFPDCFQTTIKSFRHRDCNNVEELLIVEVGLAINYNNYKRLLNNNYKQFNKNLCLTTDPQ